MGERRCHSRTPDNVGPPRTTATPAHSPCGGDYGSSRARMAQFPDNACQISALVPGLIKTQWFNFRRHNRFSLSFLVRMTLYGKCGHSTV